MNDLHPPTKAPSEVREGPSYEYFVQSIFQNNDKSQITRQKVDEHYPRWLIEYEKWCQADNFTRLLDQSRGAGAYRLWNDRFGQKFGFSIRFSKSTWAWNKCEVVVESDKKPASIFTQISEHGHFRSVRSDDVVSWSPPSNFEGSTNSIYDNFTQRVFNLPYYLNIPIDKLHFHKFVQLLSKANKEYIKIEIDYCGEPRAAIDAALASANYEAVRNLWSSIDKEGFGSNTRDAVKEWTFNDMILLPHCVHVSRHTPQVLYNHFCLGVQCVNPHAVIGEELVDTIWVKIFDSRAMLKHIKPEVAEAMIAILSNPCNKVYWRAAAIADHFPTPPEHVRHVGQPSHPINRMIQITEIEGKAFCISLSLPPQENQLSKDLFANFTRSIELFHPGVSRERVIVAWNSLDWQGVGIQSRINWARYQCFNTFAKTHWDTEVGGEDGKIHAGIKRLPEELNNIKTKQVKVLSIGESDPRDFKPGKYPSPHQFKPGKEKAHAKHPQPSAQQYTSGSGSGTSTQPANTAV
ncbi:MAG: hypothetical protein M1812_005732 [Candelaria pacifica]|nr:MAG: hypothetical protein M1812_005732 [Candelaria pacifica]